jgi:hypothetical protein
MSNSSSPPPSSTSTANSNWSFTAPFDVISWMNSCLEEQKQNEQFENKQQIEENIEQKLEKKQKNTTVNNKKQTKNIYFF